MTRIRRLYIYGICAVSLFFFATGIENLIRLLVQSQGGADTTPWLWLGRGHLRQQMSFFVALTLIDGPVWVGHWLLANRALGREERASQIRRFYLYLVMAGAMIFFVPGIIGLIRIPVWALLGATINQPFLSALGAPIGLVMVTVPIWLYHRRLTVAEAAATGEDGGLGTIRRLYFYLAAFGTVNFLLVNYARLGTSIWEGLIQILSEVTIGGGNWTRAALPGYGAAVLVFLALWWWHLAQTELVADGSGELAQAERRSLLRRLYLYGLVLICIVVGVINASTLLNDLLRALLESSDPTGTGRGLLDATGQPLVWGLVYGAFWLYQRWWLQRETGRTVEAAEQASLRRLYYYLIAAVGLTIFAFGMILLLSTLLSVVSATSEQRTLDWFRDRVSLSTTLILIGSLVWLGHWQHQQRLAEDPLLSLAERVSVWRRLYLYTAIFVTVVAILVDAASLLYQLLLVTLGERATPSLLEVTRTPLSVIVIAGAILLYHWRILQFDLRSEEVQAPAAQPFLAAVLLQATSPDQLKSVLAQLAELARDEETDLAVLQGPQLNQQVRRQLDQWRVHDPSPRPG